MDKWKEMVKDRDEALRSLSKEKIIAYCKKYNLNVPSDDRVLFGAIHKARLDVNSFNKKEKLDSIEWLLDNGFKEDGIGIPLEQKKIIIMMEVDNYE